MVCDMFRIPLFTEFGLLTHLTEEHTLKQYL